MCCSVHIDTKWSTFFSDFQLIFDQDNSMGSGDCKESPNIFDFRNKLNLSHLNIKKLKFELKFQNIAIPHSQYGS